MNNKGTAHALVVSVLCVEDDLQRFSRRLASQVNQSRMHLASVLATGTQVYPVRVDSLRGTASILRCEFRMRNTGAPVTMHEAGDVMRRITGAQVLEAHMVDGDGNSVGTPLHMRAAC
jgi:hypothetical protein